MQCVHAVLGVSSFVVNSPAKHVLHSPFPVSSCHCPLWQFRQAVAPDKEYLPATQVASHVDAVVAADVVEYLPAVQSVHVAAPADVLYLPGSQASHLPPSGPVKPALHLQLVAVPLASGEFEFDGHVVHAEAPAREYFPASHLLSHLFCPPDSCL
jgi:hypothetical protein